MSLPQFKMAKNLMREDLRVEKKCDIGPQKMEPPCKTIFNFLWLFATQSPILPFMCLQLVWNDKRQEIRSNSCLADFGRLNIFSFRSDVLHFSYFGSRMLYWENFQPKTSNIDRIWFEQNSSPGCIFPNKTQNPTKKC